MTPTHIGRPPFATAAAAVGVDGTLCSAAGPLATTPEDATCPGCVSTWNTYRRWQSEDGSAVTSADPELRAWASVLASELAAYNADTDDRDFESSLEGAGPGAYVGQRDAKGGCSVLRPDGTLLPLAPSLELRGYSPDGFDHGHAGSGPAQLALALLLDATGDPEVALRHHQDFKRSTVATWRGNVWVLEASEIRAWFAEVEE